MPGQDIKSLARAALDMLRQGNADAIMRRYHLAARLQIPILECHRRIERLAGLA